MVYVKRVPEQSTPTAQAPDATTTIDANNVMSSIPTSTVALAVIVSVFGFILLASMYSLIEGNDFSLIFVLVKCSLDGK